jgi:hypothetical protein
MQNDILPPDIKRSNKNSSKHSPMSSLRLQGHSIDDARKRLIKAEQNHEISSRHEPEAEAVIALGGDNQNKKGPHHWLKYHLSKRSKLELAILAGVFVIGAGVLGGLIMHYTKKPPQQALYVPPPVKAAPPPAPTTLAALRMLLPRCATATTEIWTNFSTEIISHVLPPERLLIMFTQNLNGWISSITLKVIIQASSRRGNARTISPLLRPQPPILMYISPARFIIRIMTTIKPAILIQGVRAAGHI